jgi:hypothetical protein
MDSMFQGSIAGRDGENGKKAKRASGIGIHLPFLSVISPLLTERRPECPYPRNRNGTTDGHR